MELYNELIRQTASLLPDTLRHWDYDPHAAWDDAGSSKI